jgi:hypothetical protein
LVGFGGKAGGADPAVAVVPTRGEETVVDAAVVVVPHVLGVVDGLGVLVVVFTGVVVVVPLLGPSLS